MKKFEQELEHLLVQLSQMGETTKQMADLIYDVVQNRNQQALSDIQVLEKQVNSMQVAIDQDAVRMLTVYGPVAADLRVLLVVTHVTAQLERIGDQSVNICEALAMMSPDPSTHRTLPKIRRMAELAKQMIADSLKAYFQRDAEMAERTRAQDDMIDALNDQVMKELLTIEVLQEVLSGAKDIADAVAQILIARYLERMADQATNICKEVIYMVKGDDVRHRSK